MLTTSFLRFTSGPCTLNAVSYPFCLSISGVGLKPNTDVFDLGGSIEDMLHPDYPYRVEEFPFPVTSASGTIAPTVVLAIDACGGYIELIPTYLTAQNTQISSTGLFDPPAC